MKHAVFWISFLVVAWILKQNLKFENGKLQLASNWPYAYEWKYGRPPASTRPGRDRTAETSESEAEGVGTY